MLIALAQLNPVAGALRQNAARVKDFYWKARLEGAGLVIYPEMALPAVRRRTCCSIAALSQRRRSLSNGSWRR